MGAKVVLPVSSVAVSICLLEVAPKAGGSTVNCREVPHEGVDFAGCNFAGRDFGGANLKDANNRRTNLHHVNLKGATVPRQSVWRSRHWIDHDQRAHERCDNLPRRRKGTLQRVVALS